MALFGLVKDKNPLATTEKKSLATALGNERPRQLSELGFGEIDLSPLWEDPNDKGNMPLILSGVAAGASVINVLLAFFKH